MRELGVNAFLVKRPRSNVKYSIRERLFVVAQVMDRLPLDALPCHLSVLHRATSTCEPASHLFHTGTVYRCQRGVSSPCLKPSHRSSPQRKCMKRRILLVDDEVAV